MTYIALLRGINVGGQKSIKMQELAKLFESLGHTGMQTYLQSGNVVFNSAKTDPSALAEKVEKTILDKFGFEVKVIIRTMNDFSKIATNNPFLKKPQAQADKLLVTFLSHSLDQPGFELPKSKNEDYQVKGREIYLYCPDGYGRTKMSNQAIEKKARLTATTRNWKTVNELLRLAKLK